VAGVRGVLRPDGAAGRFTLGRVEPPPDLAPFVEYFWSVRWDLRGEPPHEQSVLPHPCVHLVFEPGGAHVYGVDTRVFTRRLEGSGQVLGARFRAGCFRPFSPVPVADLTDQVRPAAGFFGRPGERVPAVNEAIMRAGSAQAMSEIATGFLRSVAPPRDPVAEQVAGMAHRIGTDLELRSVGQLAGTFTMNERRLQRLFAEYVGVSPKWVMRRARLHEAALRADSGEDIDWARLATGLGYADQSHLTREFTTTLGVPPARYRSR
jgi:AraC-like DNA-binding protein